MLRSFINGSSDIDLVFSDIPWLIEWRSEEDQLYILKNLFWIDEITNIISIESWENIFEWMYWCHKWNEKWIFLKDYWILDFNFSFFNTGNIIPMFHEDSNSIVILFEEENIFYCFDVIEKKFIDDASIVQKITQSSPDDFIEIAGEEKLSVTQWKKILH